MEYIKYIPLEMQNIKEYNALGATGDIELGTAKNDMNAVANNHNLSTLNEYGCTRMEKIMGIETDVTKSVEARRFTIIAKANNTIPYTLRTLQRKIETVLGNNKFRVSLENETYTLTISLFLENQSKMDEIKNEIVGMIPCNIILKLEALYNTHGDVKNKGYSHGALKAYTHGEIKTNTNL